ncbi:bactericidal permeability-increasing protein-like [Acipenser oxyrinchus oxyrinchus]|uniref:Bactericidal permeability-increasing protein n=1 Tax=Acipenser oxyrinchus oxyrinchus TaxID=40147 RepID=A0AAD8CT09_ACIOX|nr:bactericidal permeability-increasing protein-like [Acipenser oxyrinchus oxyrinchus]
MFPWWLLGFLALCPASLCINPGITGRITQNGLEYGKQIGMTVLQQKLKSIKIPDMSGKEKVSPIGKVRYSLTAMQVVSVSLPKSAVGLSPGTGVVLSIGNAYISIKGNWRVKYLRIVKHHGSFDLSVSGLTISAGIRVSRDETGRPTVSSASCSTSIGGVRIKFHGGASWLYNLFSKFIEKALRKALSNKICPLVSDAIGGLNPHLKTLNVLAKVDRHAEVEYSLVSPPVITKNYIDLGLKGEFYNIRQHREPPFSAPPFSLPEQASRMLYIGVSEFTLNSAGFVYYSAGVLNTSVTDDMIPKSSPLRLNTQTFGVFIPQIEKSYPNMSMKLIVQATQQPHATMQPSNITVEVMGSIAAYVIKPDSTLAPLFVLGMKASTSANLLISGKKLVGSVTLNGLVLSLQKSYVGPFQIQALQTVLQLALKFAVLPKVNELLKGGFPLPTIDKMNLVNPQIQILKDYVLIGTDVAFTGSLARYSDTAKARVHPDAAFRVVRLRGTPLKL